MDRFNRTPKQLTLALAALAIGAVAAVMLLAGGVPAQAASTQPQIKPVKMDDPHHQHKPEECSSKDPAEVVSSGHIAIFEVYWDDENKILVNNPCPPTVNVEVHQETDNRGRPIGDPTYSVIRVASDINIDNTIFHVPSGYEETLVTTGDVLSNKSVNHYPFLDVGDNQTAWIVSECPHDHAPEPGQFCVGFSTHLLHQEDWDEIGFQFETLRQPGLAVDDRGHAFAFHTIGDDDFPENEPHPIWSTAEPDKNEIVLEGGAYRHPNWAFTKAGTYEFQVHVKAVPNKSRDGGPISHAEAETSLVRTYTFHVGHFADLNVQVDAAESATGTDPLEPGDEVTITVIAGNAGPDDATHTEVDITLPDGLTYQSSDSADYNPTSGVWSVGTLASDDNETLTIQATVDSNTRGQAQTISAEIHALEDIGSSTVVELDPHTDDNTAEATVTPLVAANTDPIGQLILSVPENSVSTAAQKVLVGDFLVYDPDGDDLTLTTSGSGKENFTYRFTNQASDGTNLPDGVKRVLIEVAEDADLDYEYKNSYTIFVDVSDGKGPLGNADTAAADYTVRVSIMLTDVSDGFTRSVPENSPGDTAVGDPIPVNLGEGSGNPTHGLSGTGHDKFTVTAVAGGAQIWVAQGATLNHEDNPSFYLTLHAGDTPSNSQQIPVRIVVEDDPHEHLTVTLVPDVTTQTIHQYVNFTATVSNSPVASDRLKYRWSANNVGGGHSFSGNTYSLTQSETHDQAVKRKYEFYVWFVNNRGHTVQSASDTVVITWTAN